MKRRFSKSDIGRIQAGKLPEPTEDQVQEIIVDGLRCHGFIVLVTSRHKKRCRKCGEWSAGGDGATKGIPDVIARDPAWPAGQWTGLEVKKTGRVKFSSIEQKLLAESGAILVVQSLEESLAAMGYKL